MKLPSLKAGLQALSGSENTPVLVQDYEPASQVAKDALDITDSLSTHQGLRALRNELEGRLENSRVGTLLSNYVLNRDRQMERLRNLGGKEPLLEVIAQGLLPAQISADLEISYSVLSEFLNLSCSESELELALKRGADSLIAQSLNDLEQASTKEDIHKARALSELKLKIASALSDLYVPKKMIPAAAQVNVNVGSDTPTATAYLQIVEIPREELPPLKQYNSRETQVEQKAHQPIDAEYSVYREASDE